MVAGRCGRVGNVVRSSALYTRDRGSNSIGGIPAIGLFTRFGMNQSRKESNGAFACIVEEVC